MLSFDNPEIQEIYDKIKMEELKLTPEEYRKVKIASCYQNIYYLETVIDREIQFVESTIEYINWNKEKLEKERAKLVLLEKEGETDESKH